MCLTFKIRSMRRPSCGIHTQCALNTSYKHSSWACLLFHGQKCPEKPNPKEEDNPQRSSCNEEKLTTRKIGLNGCCAARRFLSAAQPLDHELAFQPTENRTEGFIHDSRVTVGWDYDSNYAGRLNTQVYEREY